MAETEIKKINGRTLYDGTARAAAKANADAIEELKNNQGTGGGSTPDSGGNADQSGVEPAEDDIPKVFFGGPLQQTKDEAVVPFRYISKTEEIIGFAEIKAQGNSSMSYPKKNQTVKMYKDAYCTEKLKADFKGWGKQNKHVYKANWIDLTHARNVVSARLWGDVLRSRADYESLPELLRTSPNQGAVDGFPVKVYAAGVYQGRYTLNIPKDKWTFNMDDELDEHCVLCGENYVSGCFRAAAKIDGSDWTDEIHDTVPASIKTRWNEVISFVMNATDEEFEANLSQYFYVDSLIDYYLFALASCGLDAMGKNQIYATYDGQKWIASMYDMDSTWGLYWNGSKFVATDYSRESYEDYVAGDGNLLYIRLENIFGAEIRARWAELKNDALSIANIINRFERFTDIAPAELVKEDFASTTGGGKFTGIPSQTTNNIQQIRAFALARQAWTDEYVNGLVYIPCTGISLSQTAISFANRGETQTIIATVTPSDTTDKLTWESSDTNVATVIDGVVTAGDAGDAVITAKCGNITASCNVNVSFAEIPCTGILLSENELTFTTYNSHTLVATVTPNNTTDAVEWSSSAPSVVSVENGVVTVKGNGNATVTATCGEYSAECSVSVAIEIDYTLNPLTDVEYLSKKVYDQTTGDLIDNANDSCTTKFALQECVYKVSLTNASYNGVYIWDENGQFVGYLSHGSNATYYINGRRGYLYAVHFYTTSDNYAVNFMPLDNRANKTESITIDLTTGWKVGELGIDIDVQSKLAAAGLTNKLTQINSVVGDCTLIIDPNPTKKDFNAPVVSLHGVRNIVSHNCTTVEDAIAYYTEHCPTLTING